MSDVVKELFDSVTVIDTETTGKEAEECELVEIATGRFVEGDWKVKSQLFKTINPIPPEA